MQLKNKVAVITGGAGDLGVAIAKAYCAAGAKVLLIGRTESSLACAVNEIGSVNLSFFVADVTDPEQSEAAVQCAVSRYGGLDIYVANAGLSGPGAAITDYPLEDFDQVMSVNVRGVWLGLKYAIPQLQKRGGGSLLITSSGGGSKGIANLSAYVASKHAVNGLMASVAMEVGAMNIRCNCVSPGPVESSMVEAIGESLGISAKDYTDMVSQDIPLGRFARVEEVAQMMVFLASDAGAYCSGTDYRVDGGNNSG